MEFHEKLQQLRKQQNFTQEQLAEKLFVTRTAVSRWESGKGYPSIESLKSISRLFSVTIDDLLSGEELVTLAETETASHMSGIYHVMCSVLDCMWLLCVFMPFYGKHLGGYIYHVNLISFTETSPENIVIYWSLFSAMVLIGAAEGVLSRLEGNRWQTRTEKASMGVHIFAVCFFAAAREPYVTLFLFLLFLGKLFVLSKLREVGKILVQRR